MRNEFIRYGLSKQLKLVGALQIIGGLGLITGYYFMPLLGFISSTGLALLMILGFGVRLKIRDSILQSAPSFIYAAINTYISINLYFLF
ncbi:hypothetical protein GCM10023115_52170 [Pontixanthobacter gangjinensis]